MGTLHKRDDGVISLVPNESHLGKEGYAVVASSGKAALVTADTDDVLGVILDGEATTGRSSIALCEDAGGTVRVKLDGTPGTVVLGTRLTITSTGTFRAITSGDTCCARALETGAADELVEAALYRPYLAS